MDSLHWHIARLGRDILPRRRKLAQAMRTETVKLHGVREGRGQELCLSICSVTFCPCNMPAIVHRRMRVIQMQATTFHRWVRWRPEWEHIGTPHRAKKVQHMWASCKVRRSIRACYPQ